MKNNSMNKAILLSLAILLFSKPQCKANETEINNPEATKTHQLSDIEKKLLNQYLEKKPGLVIRIKGTNQAAKTVLDQLEKAIKIQQNTEDSKPFDIEESKRKILTPANSLFIELYKFKLVAEPMLQKFLATDKEDINDTICLGVFKIDDSNKNKEELNKTLMAYFEEAFNDIENLKKGCEEFIKVCDAFIPNIDANVSKKADDLAKQLQSNKKKQ